MSHLGIDSWGAANVVDISEAFTNAQVYNHQPLDSWQMGKLPRRRVCLKAGAFTQTTVRGDSDGDNYDCACDYSIKHRVPAGSFNQPAHTFD